MKYYRVIKSLDELLGDEGLLRLPTYIKTEFIEDEARKKGIEIGEKQLSSGNNVLIIGSPGTGKTALMFKILEKMVAKGMKVGYILDSAETIGKEHENKGIILFYDDIPRMRRELLRAIIDNNVRGIIATARKEELYTIERMLGEDFSSYFHIIELGGMSREKLREMFFRYSVMERIIIEDPTAIDIIIDKADGLPVYIWQVIRELRISKKPLTKDYAEKIPEGMYDYVDDILWRVLDEHEERYEILATLLIMADMHKYAIHQDLYNAVFVTVKEFKEKRSFPLEEAMFSDLLDAITRYLARESATYSFRLPHDSWADVLRGKSSGPMSGEISRINTIFTPEKRREILIEAARRVWHEVLKESDDVIRRELFLENLRLNLTKEEVDNILKIAPKGVEFIEKITPEEIERLKETLREELLKGEETIDRAFPIAQRLLELGVTDKDAQIMIAVAYIRKGRKSGNKKIIEKAVEILEKIDDIKARYNLGIAYYELGDYKKAEKEFKKVVKEAKGELKDDALFNLAMVYFRRAEPKKLVKTLGEYVKKRPDDKDAVEFYELLKKIL